jgi:hypothetical protein
MKGVHNVSKCKLSMHQKKVTFAKRGFSKLSEVTLAKIQAK